MNKYVATVRVGGTNVKTTVFADSAIHARLLLQYQFGMNCIVNSPTQTNEATEAYKTIEEVLATIKPIKPLTPQQARIDGLKRQKDNVTKQLKAERDRQKLVKAQQQIFNLSR
jgi:hypothetical protein